MQKVQKQAANEPYDTVRETFQLFKFNMKGDFESKGLCLIFHTVGPGSNSGKRTMTCHPVLIPRL